MGLKERLERAAETRDIRAEQEAAKQQGSSMSQVRLTARQERDIQEALARQAKRTWRDA